tara:strand:+ start:231 stop:680 length:450 start_codon:yes stop_codon:yes gene_type:complete
MAQNILFQRLVLEVFFEFIRYNLLMEKITPQNEFVRNPFQKLKEKYSGELINVVWQRLAEEGIDNADELIGTRLTINNIDSEKFWSSVKQEDIEKQIIFYESQIDKQLENYKKYGDEFVPERGEFINNDTSYLENKIKELNEIKSKLFN